MKRKANHSDQRAQATNGVSEPDVTIAQPEPAWSASAQVAHLTGLERWHYATMALLDALDVLLCQCEAITALRKAGAGKTSGDPLPVYPIVAPEGAFGESFARLRCWLDILDETGEELRSADLISMIVGPAGIEVGGESYPSGHDAVAEIAGRCIAHAHLIAFRKLPEGGNVRSAFGDQAAWCGKVADSEPMLRFSAGIVQRLSFPDALAGKGLRRQVSGKLENEYRELRRLAAERAATFDMTRGAAEKILKRRSSQISKWKRWGENQSEGSKPPIRDLAKALDFAKLLRMGRNKNGKDAHCGELIRRAKRMLDQENERMAARSANAEVRRVADGLDRSHGRA